MTYAYYPGCSLHSTAREFDLSTRAVMQSLRIELEELHDWSCCGGSVAAAVSHDVGLAMAARNVALARREKLDLLAACSGCYNKSARANQALAQPREKARIEPILEAMGVPLPDHAIRVRNVVDVLANDIDLAAHVRRPLEGLKLACYYGCLLTRPADITGWDSVQFPTSMDRLCTTCGADVVEFRSKTRCCGGPIAVSNQERAYELSKALLDEAKSLGIDALVLACPLCDTNLELHQPEIERTYQVEYNLPILYITEIVGLALGLSPRQLGLQKHIVSPRPILNRLGL
jgi:heterodisulfide reductase subunit B